MSLDDERVQFYLPHREQLEEWFALRAEVAAAIDHWLISLRGDVESLALDLGVEMLPALADAAYPSLYLKRPTWVAQTARRSDRNDRPPMGARQDVSWSNNGAVRGRQI